MNLLFLLLRGRSSYSATKTSRSSVSNARLIAKYANFTFRPTNWAYYVLKALRSHPAATSGNVKGFPEFHVVYRDAKNDPFREYAGANQASHAVASSGTPSFFILDQPEVGGGDTLFLSQVEAYNRPSPEFQKRLEGLQVLHSAVPQAEFSRKRNGPCSQGTRRDRAPRCSCPPCDRSLRQSWLHQVNCRFQARRIRDPGSL